MGPGADPVLRHEILLVDGFSTDDTVRVARQVRPDVVVVTAARTRQGRRDAHRVRGGER